MAVAPIVLWSLAAGAAGAGAGALIAGAGKKAAAPPTPALPPAPDPAVSEKEKTSALTQQKRKASIPGAASGRSSTLLTGPAGLLGSAPTQTKTLLGS